MVALIELKVEIDLVTFIVSGPADVLPVEVADDAAVGQEDDDQRQDVEEDHAQEEVQELYSTSNFKRTL